MRKRAIRSAPASLRPRPATEAKPDTASAEISTDVSYLPDLTAYLDDLLRTRERLAAAIDGVDEWARADATPAEEEITRIRRLIGRVKGDMTRLSDPERAQVDEAVTVIRKHRAVSLGMPSVRVTRPHPQARPPHDTPWPCPARGGEPADRGDEDRTPGRLRPPPAARHRNAQPRRRRRHRDHRGRDRPRRRRGPGLPLPAPRPARQDPRPRSRPARRRRHRRPGRHLRLAASRPARRPRALQSGSTARVRQLEKRLSEALGEQAWRESGLGVPADIDALSQKVTHLEQQAIDLRLQLEERDQDLAAARAANRELMAQLNATPRHQ